MARFGKKPSTTPTPPPPAPHTDSESKESNALVPLSPTEGAIARTGPGTMVNRDWQLPSFGPETPQIIYTDPKLETADYKEAKRIVIETLLDRLDFLMLDKLAPAPRRQRIRDAASDSIKEIDIPLNAAQEALLKEHVVDEVLGLGPLEALLADPDVADIMVNTHERVYIEKFGRILRTDITFASEKHLLNIVQKIVTRVGRRIDETSPMVDARMPDGSRFNAIVPPLALDGTLVSIRKFKKTKMPLEAFIEYDSMSPEMVKFLAVCTASRLNIVISGGTGSGKTTLLNALSGHIGPSERVITIEDAAELQLQQPHVLRLETRAANLEGQGEINQRALVRNALRMRPDRIILGEIRGDEVIDVLQAMNTGHDGSMVTIHSNSPRDCLTRIENLIGMAGIKIPVTSLRQQITSAIHLVVQIERMRDGHRRITQIEEVVGIDGDIIGTQTLFGYRPGPVNEQGKLMGEFFCTGIRPRFLEQVAYYGHDKELIECLKPSG